MKTSDLELLKKENIVLQSSTKNFNEVVEKTIDLKKKIENEINEINKLYEKIFDELTKSFMKRHEELVKQENNLKENLKNEITKIKKSLEYFLNKCMDEIKLSERINKGITEIQNGDEISIKDLSYISKLNINKKQMINLLQELMKSLKISYLEEKDKIEFKEFYFNGIPIPNKIGFKDVSNNSLNIFWSIDNDNTFNIDFNKLKYIVEMRKENESFLKAHEGVDKKCKIENLSRGICYDFRLCSAYNDIYSPWSKTFRIKVILKSDLSNLDSFILKDCNRKDEYVKKMLEWCGFTKMELLFRGSRDGMNSKNFHDKCDNKGQTITLFQNQKDNIFGGYTSISWSSDGKWHTDKDCFLFTLTNIYGSEPTKFKNINKGDEVYHYTNDGPVFGYGPDIACYSDFVNLDSFTNFPQRFQDVLGKGSSIFSGDSKNTYFKIKEIEVFKVTNYSLGVWSYA